MNTFLNDTAIVNLISHQIQQQISQQMQSNNPWTPAFLCGIVWLAYIAWQKHKEIEDKVHKDLTRDSIAKIEKRQLEIKKALDDSFEKNGKILDKLEEVVCELKHTIKKI